MDAVYAFAYALSELHQTVCPGRTDVCDAMKLYDGGDFYREYLLNVSFKGQFIFYYYNFVDCIITMHITHHIHICTLSIHFFLFFL